MSAAQDPEINKLLRSEPSEITDIDISQNDKTVIAFTKRPWQEFVVALASIAIPLLGLYFFGGGPRKTKGLR